MKFENGMLVKSLAGHDAGELFIIIEQEGEYVSLVDGKTRTLKKPKRKNKKHLQVIYDEQWQMRAQLIKDKVTDVQLKRLIQCYKRGR